MTAVFNDHFELFNLPRRFELDAAELDRAYLRVQSLVHPDRFASASAAEKRAAMSWAARANDALQTLKSPSKRAAYLCEINGAPIAAESNTMMPAAFLDEQMQWREALEEAADDQSAVARLLLDTNRAADEALTQIAGAIDRDHDYQRAATLVRQLFFIEKFRDELARSEAGARIGAPAASR